MARKAVLFCGLLLAQMALPAPARAKSSKSFTYGYGSVWSTTIRFLRADKGYRITDKDKETGYILFVYPGQGAVKECQASMEIIPVVSEEGTRQILVQLGIAHQPTYIEVHLLDILEQKLLEELGQPPPPQRVKRDRSPKKPGSGAEGKKRP